MNERIFTAEDIKILVKPLAEKYHIQEVYIFGSYARGDATEKSDLDFLIFGGENFKPTMIFSFAEELRELIKKTVDVFEIRELNIDSEFYKNVMQEKVLVA